MAVRCDGDVARADVAQRKGIERLLSAYFEAFDASQNVELLLHTYLYKSDAPFDVRAIEARVRDVALEYDDTLSAVAKLHGVDILTVRRCFLLLFLWH